MGPASCSARSAQTNCNCQLGCQPTRRPSGFLILTAFNQSLQCCHLKRSILLQQADLLQISLHAASLATTNTACPAAAFLTPQQRPLMLSLQLQQPQLLASELSSVLLALPPAWRTIVRPSTHLVSGSLGLRQTTQSRCSDRPAPHHQAPSATSTDPTRACL